MAGGERVGDGGRQQGGTDRRERAVLAEVPVQVRAVDEVHHQGEQITLDHQVPDPDDVRVTQAYEYGALAQEAHHDVGIAREFFLEHLDRDDAVLVAHPGAPDGPRGPASEYLLEEVLAAYRPHVMRSLVLVVLRGTRWRRYPVDPCSAATRRARPCQL
ncbi:hypothetical protein M2266_002735 [Streptomyces sp. SPB162]|nr:hypothetical protein [Streptomyces sp. SPB162]